MKDTDEAAQAKLAAIKSYVTTKGIPMPHCSRWPSSAR